MRGIDLQYETRRTEEAQVPAAARCNFWAKAIFGRRVVPRLDRGGVGSTGDMCPQTYNPRLVNSDRFVGRGAQLFNGPTGWGHAETLYWRKQVRLRSAETFQRGRRAS